MRLLGLTATPTYTDEKKRGWLKELFPQDILYQVSVNQLIAQNILARPKFEKPYHTHFEPEFDEADYKRWINTLIIPEDVIEQLANNRNRNQYIAQVYAENKEKFNKTIIFADRWKQCVQLCEFKTKRSQSRYYVFSSLRNTNWQNFW